MCAGESDQVCFTCYFSLILMALQSAKHFNRARERLVKHTHTHHKTEGRLARCNIVVWRESVRECVCIERVSQGDGDTR